MSVEPSNGLTDARHHIYWADEGEYIGHPVDDFESSRREWVPSSSCPTWSPAGRSRPPTWRPGYSCCTISGSGRTRCPHVPVSCAQRLPDRHGERAQGGDGRNRGKSGQLACSKAMTRAARSVDLLVHLLLTVH